MNETSSFAFKNCRVSEFKINYFIIFKSVIIEIIEKLNFCKVKVDVYIFLYNRIKMLQKFTSNFNWEEWSFILNYIFVYTYFITIIHITRYFSKTITFSSF